MLDIGQVIDGKYKIVRQLGHGGMGAVFEAVHLRIKRRVAVKVILDDRLRRNADAMARFRREASAAGRIETQHIVQVLDTGEDPGSGFPYIAMEYLAGEDLDKLVCRLGPLPPELVMRILAQALLGLAKAHDAGVIHRDIKPGNLFIATRDAGEVVVKLLDFGIAKIKTENQALEQTSGVVTQTGVLMGSLDYLSPEQATGSKDIDHRTDIWSMGGVAYKALVGRTPHHHYENFGRRLIAICQEQPRHIQEQAPWVPRGLAAQVHSALQIDQPRRFRTAMDWFDVLSIMLPDGWTLHERMLRSLTDAQRSVVSPRLAMTPSGALLGSVEAICREDMANQEEVPCAPTAAVPVPGPQPVHHPVPSPPTFSRQTSLTGIGRARTVSPARPVQPVVPASPPTAISPGQGGVFARLEQTYAAAARWDALTDLYSTRLKTRKLPSEKTDLLRRMARVFGQKMRNKERAFNTLMTAFQLDFVDPRTLEQLESLAEETSRWGELTSTANRWLSTEQDPVRCLQLHMQLARWCIDNGHPEDATAHLEKAIPFAGNQVQPLRSLASMYRKMGHVEDAVRVLTQALQHASQPHDSHAVSQELGEISRELDEPSTV